MLVGMDKLTIAQAAAKYDVPPSTVHYAIAQGNLPAERIGNKMWLISPADMRVWLKKKRMPQRSPRNHWRKRGQAQAPAGVSGE